MPHAPRPECIDCERSLDSNQFREVGAGLLRLFLAVRLSKRIRCDDMICQKCRSQFLKWQQKMEGDFDNYVSVAEIDMEPVNNDDDSVMSVGVDNVATIFSNANIDTQPNSISIPIFRCSKSHQSCVFCDEKDSCSAKVLSRIQRTMVFLKCGIFVAPGSRCCTSHLCEDGLTIKSFDHIRVSKPDRWKIDSDEFQIFV
ncbi:unnamed protein product [Rotaria sp. Silwood2]|nr:unnamed protein product [Rotaria sp. Silwood2]CAF4427485.1 unnamed protein product [Rotaria sp. Silwood2]